MPEPAEGVVPGDVIRPEPSSAQALKDTSAGLKELSASIKAFPTEFRKELSAYADPLVLGVAVGAVVGLIVGLLVGLLFSRRKPEPPSPWRSL